MVETEEDRDNWKEAILTAGGSVDEEKPKKAELPEKKEKRKTEAEARKPVDIWEACEAQDIEYIEKFGEQVNAKNEMGEAGQIFCFFF